MSNPDRSRLSPARYGLTDPRAEHILRSCGWWQDGAPMLHALSRAADEDLALAGLDRLRERLGDEWPELKAELETDVELRGRLVGVLGASSALGDFLVANPQRWHRLRSGCELPDLDVRTQFLLAELGADPQGNTAVRALKLAYRAQLMEIAASDLAHLVEPTLPELGYAEVTANLTDLAVASLRAALVVAGNEVKPDPDCRLAVIAMGKCGARELNYVSDVDVVFVAEPAEQLPAATRLAGAMMRIATEACFEVDAALRPEGKAGALVRTLDGHLSYYKRWARTWEFQALLKATPAAGDAELGRQYIDAVGPMVWTAADRENFVTDVQAMRRRVEEHLPADIAERELKLGPGGLRDVEFAVQLLQLVHGRTDEELRLQSTVEALAVLGHGGYVGRADAAGMSESYEFLRLLEHRLQLQKLLRTHTFPPFDDEDRLRWLARSCGLRGDGRRSIGQVLLNEFRHQAKQVRRLHEKLFYRPLLEAVAKVPTGELRLTPQQAQARLAALGYAAPDGALRHLQALTAGVSRRAAIQTTLLPVLLAMLAETPDPDGGLLAYRKVSEGLADTPWYLRLLRDEGAVAQRLAHLLGTSALIPELLIRAPEVLRLLGDLPALAGRDPAEVALSLRSTVARYSGQTGGADPARAVAAARSSRRHEILRVACADLLGEVTVQQVCTALSSVWVAVLRAALDACISSVAQRDFGGTAPGRVAVIGMGRLGGAELGYGSDADVMFVCEPIDAEDGEAIKFATAVVGMLRRLLGMPSQDPALQVDVDLRPEGRSGPMVRTLNSYRAYYSQWGETWEAQALLRARSIAGDEDLGRRFIETIDPIRYPAGGLDQNKVREIRRIKARVEAERLPRGADPATHTKLGRGGLADVEWTIQLLQLQHAHEHPGLRTPSTLDALDAAADVGVLTEQDRGELMDAWTLATRARNAVTLVRGKPTDQLPRTGREMIAVARSLGYPADADPGQFIDDYRRTTRHARTVVDRLFYGT
ncbi:bifunctional [glutamine synthetase] adenylyltransferase/[glutamine synthetase]-adenylyl-L-tyrosine phosphorylase [Pseudonocardiaceae bacterium YIM PH 21723]|nr:bifunctional [glutamine synthetase] adenylyltransferase/[glutamine synthetase]-adenylyl-L-tyrosine phosphorylase [Pseudonocardiaceae bacterium YIM PH 21723]